MGGVISDISDGLGVYKSLYGLGRSIVPKVRNRIVTPYRVQKLSDDVFSSNIKFGSTVTVKGKLTRYAPTNRPLSYSEIIPSQAHETVSGVKLDPVSKRLHEERTMKARFKSFQFPVQTLPSIEGESGRFCIAWLYPTEFEGFLLDKKKGRDGGSEADSQGCGLEINSTHRPIPVLVHQNDLENIGESLVTLTGVVSLLSEDMVDLFAYRACEFRLDFYSGFLRFQSNSLGFCIDCRSKFDSDFINDGRLSSLPGSLYVEGHFQGVVDDRYFTEFKDSIPKGFPLSFRYTSIPGKSFYFSEDEYVSVVGADPSIFGFYVEADLADAHDMHIKVGRLRNFYSSFRKKASGLIRKKYSIDTKFKPDFVFDYKRQSYFHPEGVLSSLEVDEVLEKNRELTETVDWLRNN